MGEGISFIGPAFAGERHQLSSLPRDDEEFCVAESSSLSPAEEFTLLSPAHEGALLGQSRGTPWQEIRPCLASTSAPLTRAVWISRELRARGWHLSPALRKSHAHTSTIASRFLVS